MDLFRFDPPDLTERDARAIAADVYGVTGSTRRLRGERSHNTLFTDEHGRQFVLKVASPGEPRATVEFHAEALLHLEQVAPGLPVARMVPARDGTMVPSVERGGRAHAVRLVTFLPGTTFRDDERLSLAALGAIGVLLGSLSTALRSFDHPAADEFMPWDIANGLVVDDELWRGLAPAARATADRSRARLEGAIAAMADLPRQVIHNDGHAGNLLRRDDSSDVVTGIIDFGDLVRTVTAADLGVAGANLVPHQPDPAAALASLAAGFHRHRPLSAAEIAAIPDLVLARLVLSTLLTHHQVAHAPHIADAVAAELPGIVANLERWLNVDPRTAADHIREAL